jgi:hypothetical protein
LPLALFDPGNDCNGKGLLSGSGAYLMGKWNIEQVLEFYRGAFAMFGDRSALWMLHHGCCTMDSAPWILPCPP